MDLEQVKRKISHLEVSVAGLIKKVKKLEEFKEEQLEKENLESDEGSIHKSAYFLNK